MNSEIQETIAEIKSLIHLLGPMIKKKSIAEIYVVFTLLEPLLKKLEEHLNVVEKRL